MRHGSVRRPWVVVTDGASGVGAAQPMPRVIGRMEPIPQGDLQCPGGDWARAQRRPAHLVVHCANWDLCEIGYELAKGFHSLTDWGFWQVRSGSSWIREREWWEIGIKGPLGGDQLRIVRQLVEMADIIHLNSHHNLPWIDEAIIGKRVLMHHHGCRFRQNWRWAQAEERRCGYGRVVSTPDLLLHQDGARDLVWLPSPINCTELSRNYPRWERDPEGPVRIVHGYTVRQNKGTDAFEREADGIAGAEVQLLHGLPRRHALWYISQADVYFATLLYGPGLATIEAMACGIPALCGCTADELVMQREAIGVSRTEDLPWIYVTEETLGRWLRDLTADRELREYWGEKGRRYVQQWHDVPAVVQRAQAIYEGLGECTGVAGRARATVR